MAVPTLTFAEADEDLWHEYDVLARRAYGHPVDDIMRLGVYADRRVALCGGRVVAGGLGLLIPQWFGGRPVPSASMAGGCVAPEERGGQLAARLIAERLRPLQEQGAVLATLWTASTGYVRRMGWEAPAQVYSWTVPTDELRRRFRDADVDIQHGETAQLPPLRDALAARWNGTWQRPTWWVAWQQGQHPGVNTYRFGPSGEALTGVMAVAGERHPAEGRRLVVHDFWAADQPTAAAMLAFLGRHNSRIPTVAFQRTGLPPGPLLLHQLHRSGEAAATAWHPWMLRVLDLPRAVELRGWPQGVDLDLPLDIESEDGTKNERYTLRITSGRGELAPGGGTAHLTLTRRQFAVWYAGGYRSAASAELAGLYGDPTAITGLLMATADREPWLGDYF
ncbi:MULTISPECIES: GNAT family N-acetyltransferase [Streptomyces]|uniref:GNAT family N-acetyltransferase n=1 Tax=Streptomyces TaxID=1883 RepID=UPI001F5E7C11|nr:GNAT family N-acetyltransferase [Streptomyces kasugaensis]